jgi:hypothetical protein
MIIRERVDDKTLKLLAKPLAGYIKFVADIEKGILAAGSLRHFDDEQTLLADGSEQENLWGGGLDLETGGLDFDSMINLRPKENASREVLSQEVRQKMEKIARGLLR